LAAQLSRIPRALLRAVRHRTPVRWLERIHLVCNGLVFMFHEVHDDSMRGLRTGCTVGCLKSVIMQLRNEGWDIVSLDDVMSRLRNGDPSRRFAVLTFDDGYRDLLTRALPVLEHHDAPFTVFVPTGAPTRELHSWWLGVRALFERRDEVAIASMGTMFTCGDIEGKMKGYQEVSKWIHQDYRRAPLLTETFREYKISLTSLNDSHFMNEAELRVLARHRLATVGAHTTSHGALSTLDDDLARHEMSDNRVYLERLLDRQVIHLAYPYGTPAACGPREFRLAADVGFCTAVTARYGPVFSAHRHYPHALPRVAAAPARAECGFPAVIRDLRNTVRDPSAALIQ
jgi:peptidoglycan/xylan/chitin deacetylase (PgdA/CDA1 family)